MNNNKEIAIPKEKSVIAEQLAVYPPKLRKLGRYMIDIGQFITLKEACEAVNVNYDSVRATIPRLKRKGIDFNVYMNNQYMKFLIDNKLDVSKSLVDGAISGTHADRKLFFQLTGDLVEHTRVDHNIQAKIVVFSPSPGVIPEDIKEKKEREKDKDGVQIIDLDFDKD